MTNRKLLIPAIAMLAVLFVPVIAHAQPADPAPAVDATAPAPAVVPAADAPVTPDAPAVDPAEKEVTAKAIGKQVKKTVSDWRTYGWLAGLGALIALLIMVLKYKPIDALFVRWEVKYLKPLIACVLGGASAGIVSYLADGDVVNAIIAGLVIIGPVAVGYFETFSKIKSRNRDNGKNGDPK